MSKEQETTYFRFMSEIRAFLSKLLKDPVKAQPSKYLKDRDITRKKLIDELLKRDVIERHEKILDPTNSDEKEAKYVVKFKVHKKDFEKRIHRIYIKYFEKNINESVFENEEEMKEQILNGPDGEVYKTRGGINEDGGDGGATAGASGGDGSGGATSTTSVASETSRKDVGFDVALFGTINRPGYLADRNKKKKKTTNKILGKTIQAEMKKPKKIYITEEQFNRILKEEGLGAGGATTTTSVASNTTDGQLGPVRPGCMTFTKSDGSPDNSAFEREPGFSVKHVGDK